jgi:hypothetical protein
VRPAALSNLSSEAVPDAPPNQALTPQPDFAMADCCTRLANKINAARSTNPLIWTALTLSRPFGTQFVSRVLTQVQQGRRKVYLRIKRLRIGVGTLETSRLPIDEDRMSLYTPETVELD